MLIGWHLKKLIKS